MLFFGSKTSSKLGLFPKLKNLIFLNRPGPELVNIRDEKFLTYPMTQVGLRSSKRVVQIILNFFGLVNLVFSNLVIFNFVSLRKRNLYCSISQ